MLEVSRPFLALETFGNLRIAALEGLDDTATKGYNTTSSDVPVIGE